MSSRAALVLAGGSAKRFQAQHHTWQDKALAELEGKPLLVHAIQNLQDIVDEVVVCVNSKERKAQYSQVIAKYGLDDVKFVVDEKNSPINGPSLAIMSGLKALSAMYCLTVPCDMPFLKQEVADYMFKVAEGFDVAVPMWPDGTLTTLLMILRRNNSTEITQTLCALKKPRADSIPRAASKLLLISPLKEIKKLDQDLKSFININRKEDLAKLQSHRIEEAAETDNLKLNKGDLPVSDLRLLREGKKKLDEGKFLEARNIFASCTDDFETQNIAFWAGVSAEKLGESLLKVPSAAKAREAYFHAAKNYQTEAEMYTIKGCRLLADRALADSLWYQLQIK